MSKKELIIDAVGIAEGWIEAENEQEVIDAWQQLHDTGLAYNLQGWFGRTARNLIEEGIINE
jgi:Leu/Phe-tRNA-protein transferase